MHQGSHSTISKGSHKQPKVSELIWVDEVIYVVVAGNEDLFLLTLFD